MNQNEYLEYILELFSGHGNITARAMFGGYGLYKNGIIFAIVAYDEVYFKVDESNQKQYEELNSQPFTYEANGKEHTMSYWKLPLEIAEDNDELPKWIEQSYQISLKNKKKRK